MYIASTRSRRLRHTKTHYKTMSMRNTLDPRCFEYRFRITTRHFPAPHRGDSKTQSRSKMPHFPDRRRRERRQTFRDGWYEQNCNKERRPQAMDTFYCQSEDRFPFATRPELDDAKTHREGGPLPSRDISSPTKPIEQVQNEIFGMDQQTYYTQESDSNSRKISTPATRSTADSIDHEAESLVSSEDDQDVTVGLSLMQKRAQNEQRNQAFLSRIGLEYGMKPASKVKAPKRKPVSSPSKNTVEAKIEKRGMLLTTYHDMGVNIRASSSGNPRLSDILLQFPFRESEITKLTGYLEAGAAQIKNNFVPFPVFVTGPAGVGKTAVVRTCVDFLKRSVNEQNAVVLDSYVDCSALDEPSIDVLARKVYRQLANNLVESGEYGSDHRGRFISSMMDENDGKCKYTKVTNDNLYHIQRH